MRAIPATTAILAMIATPALARPATEPTAPPPETQLTIVLAGDTGLNGSFEPVFAGFGTKQGQRLAWHEASTAIAREINGDINFANLETVVTDRNDLKPNPKLFGFRTHPDGVRHLMQIGFNVFSTANNHAMDFGLDGARETLKHLAAIGIAHAGLGINRAEARTPRLLTAKERTIALEALGIIGSGYTSPAEDEDRPGQLSYQSAGDVDDATASLVAAKADYKILSVHYGQEFEVATASDDRRRMTAALAGADLVVGHHQHVPAGVEIIGGKPIFYGLGNFMHWGTQDMSRFDICRDYGLIARVHIAGTPGRPLTLRAIEALPITAMHKRPERRTPEDAAARIHVLNHLADQFGANGVRFAIEADGTGLYCAPGADRLQGPIGERCRAGTKVTAPAPDLARKIETACARHVVRIVDNEGEQEPEFAPVALTADPGE
jgi:poly-gamma-glutamate synthesis protein (capsule biosynthesis protein)